MKYYHVVLQSNETAPLPGERNIALLRMEMMFTLGDEVLLMPYRGRPSNMEHATAGDIIKGVIRDLKLIGLVHVTEVKEITREEARHYA